jgi:hypothetical protein
MLSGWSGFVNQGSQEAGTRCGKKRQAIENHERSAYLMIIGKLFVVTRDYESDSGGQYRGQPREVLLPFHAEFVPVGRSRAG